MTPADDDRRHVRRPRPPLPTALPPVERRAAMPAGFRAGGAATGSRRRAGRTWRSSRRSDGPAGRPAAAAAVFTPNAFAAAPGPPVAGATSRPTTVGYGWTARSSRRAAAPTRRPAPPGDADQARGRGGRSRRPSASRPSGRSCCRPGVIGTRLPLDLVGPAIAAPRAGTRRDRRRRSRPRPRRSGRPTRGRRSRRVTLDAAGPRRPGRAGHASPASPRASA